VFSAIIMFKDSPLSEEMLAEELKKLVDEMLDW
jgi:hypothetical protein